MLRSSLPGVTPQVGFTRLAARNSAQLGQARVAVQSIHLRKDFLTKKMDARVISAFTRVFDALLPAHDPFALGSRFRGNERKRCVDSDGIRFSRRTARFGAGCP